MFVFFTIILGVLLDRDLRTMSDVDSGTKEKPSENNMGKLNQEATSMPMPTNLNLLVNIKYREQNHNQKDKTV